MISTTHYKQGDVILIPFPFTDLSTLKQRPAVVISSNSYNVHHADIIICAITSQIPKALEPFDYLLSSTELKKAQLPKSSMIKVDKIITIDKRLVRKTLGNLPDETIRHLTQLFYQILTG